MKTLAGGLALVCFLLAASLPASAEETLTFGRFGKVILYQTEATPSNVILFVSGDGGWNLGVIDMARALSRDGALVAGIDITTYLRALNRSDESCLYPAADFENLSKYIQKKQGLSTYRRPLLVGYSSGATLVYAVLTQAPPNTFPGAISLGFCPTLPLTKPLCKGYGLESTKGEKAGEWYFLPAKRLEHPWIALQGTIDRVCHPEETKAYVEQVPKGALVLLPKVGHGFSVQRNWMPQFRQAVHVIGTAQEAGPPPHEGPLSDLPLIELPARGNHRTLAVIISGDGGWASLDREIGNDLAGRGIPVVGLDSLRYFWSARTPEGSSNDLNRILSHYLQGWKKEKVVLIGYSLGADVLPFMVSRLPTSMRDNISGVVLLGPSAAAQFEFHVADWLGIASSEAGAPVLPELEKLSGLRVLCVSGSEERNTVCRKVDPAKIEVEIMGGGHHFSGDYAAMAAMIVRKFGLE